MHFCLLAAHTQPEIQTRAWSPVHSCCTFCTSMHDNLHWPATISHPSDNAPIRRCSIPKTPPPQKKHPTRTCRPAAAVACEATPLACITWQPTQQQQQQQGVLSHALGCKRHTHASLLIMELMIRTCMHSGTPPATPLLLAPPTPQRNLVPWPHTKLRADHYALCTRHELCNCLAFVLVHAHPSPICKAPLKHTRI